ncbi:protein of unknown function [Candidatus Hydrogenisulfobacillus filiaventi]|uniref:Uncharacterized protein n=1 Tax=Candidatus Hydrogenisulfobacillus filiaventi TaxID=2707344 RepID=A0A6F8ZJE5_9FIRM|nr:protein of unknown function [Candidatus Hydrogenisulfobacillus filiaventi]
MISPRARRICRMASGSSAGGPGRGGRLSRNHHQSAPPTPPRNRSQKTPIIPHIHPIHPGIPLPPPFLCCVQSNPGTVTRAWRAGHARMTAGARLDRAGSGQVCWPQSRKHPDLGVRAA